MKEVNREDLYAEVWREPMTTVAVRYGVSSNYLARVCESLNVPRPARGYWAKLAVNKAPKQPALPPLPLGERLALTPVVDPIKEVAETALPRDQKARKANKRQLGTHPLLDGVKAHFAKTRRDDSGLLKPYKRLLPDLVLSEAMLEPGLALANTLYNHFEAAGHHVLMAAKSGRFHRAAVEVRDFKSKHDRYPELWWPERVTIVAVGQVAIGLTIFERTEEVDCQYVDGKYVDVDKLTDLLRRRAARQSSWTFKRERASGKFCIQAYCPYNTASWTRQWRTDDSRKWPAIIEEIVASAQAITVEMTELVRLGDLAAEARRLEWEEQSRRWKQEREKRLAAEALKNATAELKEIIRSWAETKAMHAFFEQAEQSLDSVDEGERHALRERIHQARAVMQADDPLFALLHWKTPAERVEK